MREADKDPLRLDHIIEAANNVVRFIEGKSLENIQKDDILFFAIVKNIEIIGEAAFMLTKDYKENNPEIPWRQIAGMRHVLVHDYYKISPIEVYKVATEDLPIIIPKIIELKDKLKQ